MAVNGKQKGNSFERKMANLLSDRFKSITGIDKSFRRNPDSGSFFGGTNTKRTESYDTEKATFGDLICPANFKFAVECKHYKSPPTFTSIVKGNVAQWDTWLSQASQDASNSKKGMMLIVKYNGVDEIVFVNNEYSELRQILLYKGYFCYTLKDILNLTDAVFFETNSL